MIYVTVVNSIYDQDNRSKDGPDPTACAGIFDENVCNDATHGGIPDIDNEPCEWFAGSCVHSDCEDQSGTNEEECGDSSGPNRAKCIYDQDSHCENGVDPEVCEEFFDRSLCESALISGFLSVSNALCQLVSGMCIQAVCAHIPPLLGTDTCSAYYEDEIPCIDNPNSATVGSQPCALPTYISKILPSYGKGTSITSLVGVVVGVILGITLLSIYTVFIIGSIFKKIEKEEEDNSENIKSKFKEMNLSEEIDKEREQVFNEDEY
jgi:hypothetical protein